MQIKERFRSGKWLIWFLVIFLFVWVAHQVVANMRLLNDSRICATALFSWFWPGNNWQSQASVTNAVVTLRTDSDAIVRVDGQQKITFLAPNYPVDKRVLKSETVNYSAKLTFYRLNNNWVLSKMELLR